jgi:hypothetical protein
MYLIIFLVLLGFLIHLGVAPWLVVISHPWIFVGVMIVTGTSLFVQAYTFRLCLPNSSSPRPLHLIVRAWSLGGITGLVAPIFAGFAVRTGVLKSMGINIRDSGLGTLKQIMFNLEYSLLVTAMVLFVFPWDSFPWLGIIMSLVWLLWWQAKRFVQKKPWLLPKRYQLFSTWLLAPAKGQLSLLLFGLPGLMALNYQLAFYGFGIGVGFHESLLLATLTVLISVAVMIPNGLGVLDLLWVSVAQHQGLDLTDSVGMVLLLRLGYVCSASLLWCVLAFIPSIRFVE